MFIIYKTKKSGYNCFSFINGGSRMSRYKNITEKEIGKILRDHKLYSETKNARKVKGKQANFSGYNLAKINFKGAELAGANFEGANLVSANLEGANCINTNFKRANLEGANFKKANLESANLQNTFVKFTDFEGANCINVNLVDAMLDMPNLKGSIFKNANLKSARCLGVDFVGANFEGANLFSADLSYDTDDDGGVIETRLAGANFKNANFRNADLRGVHFVDNPLAGLGHNMEAATIKKSVKGYVKREAANIEGANFEGANLEGAQLGENVVKTSTERNRHDEHDFTKIKDKPAQILAKSLMNFEAFSYSDEEE